MGFMDSLSQRKSRKSLRGLDLPPISEREEDNEERPRRERRKGRDREKEREREGDGELDDYDLEEEEYEQQQQQQQSSRRTRDKRKSVHRRSQSFTQLRWSKVFRRSMKKSNSSGKDAQKDAGEEDEIVLDENGLPILRLSLDRLIPKDSPWDDVE